MGQQALPPPDFGSLLPPAASDPAWRASVAPERDRWTHYQTCPALSVPLPSHWPGGTVVLAATL